MTSNTPVGVREQQSVPFFDLRPSHAGMREALIETLAAIVDSGGFTNGPAVSEFEAAFADFVGADHCVGLASGLDALRFALLGLEIGEGDEVIVPANTFIATFEAVSQAGAKPVPVDVTFEDYNIDVAALAAAIGPATAAVMPVHLYGQMADMRALIEATAAHEVRVIEDACQAHGAARDGFCAGAVGTAAAFSFYPAKNLGAFGDAGALVTNDPGLESTVRALREHGQREKYHHFVPGYTARLDTIQAAVLQHKLPFLDGWNRQRAEAAAYYLEALDGVGDLALPPVAEHSSPVWHLFVVRTAKAAELAEHLRSNGIGTGRHYPQPPHLSAAYSELGYKDGDFPRSEQLAREGLSLPLFPGIRHEQLEAVAAAVGSFFADGHA